jgi:hypothetical protein
MGAHRAIPAVFATLIASGCASGPPFIEAAQPQALQTAQRRAQFEFNCPAATAQLLSQEMMTSPLQYTRFAPPDRAEYTIGVAGCGQRHTYLVVCTDSGGCVAVGARAN